jgi:hypothetical protein
MLVVEALERGRFRLLTEAAVLERDLDFAGLMSIECWSVTGFRY